MISASVVSSRPATEAAFCSAERLTLVDVITERGGAATRVVCGANNVPAPGRKVLWGQVGATLPQAAVGKIKLLAQSGDGRSPSMPDLPTLQEAGFKGVALESWFACFAPLGTPPAVIARLAGDITKTMKSQEVRERLIAAGLEVVDSTPEAYAAFRKTDLAMWARMIKQANIRAD